MKFRALSDTYRRRNPGVRVYYGIPVIPDCVIQRYTEKSGIIFNGIQVKRHITDGNPTLRSTHSCAKLQFATQFLNLHVR